MLLINPLNELVAITDTTNNYFNRFRIWKPLALMVLAGRTPPDWEVQLIDENLGKPDYSKLPNPDLVGVSAFTSQAKAAYEVAAHWRARGVKVVMGGVHATYRTEEALQRVDTVVTGEADDLWPRLLDDARNGKLERVYQGGFADMGQVPAARHDLLPDKYFFGSIQVSRGCPVGCSFCSVTVFNGAKLRSRQIDQVVEELKRVPESFVLICDDNLIGTSKKQIAYAKDLFRAMIAARHGKRWMGQVTINFGDDPELLQLARDAGCFGVLIGFESPTNEGLAEVRKTFNTKKNRDLKASVRRIHQHGIQVAGSFALGLDVDQRGIGRKIAEAATHYGVDVVNTLFLTPLPGTRLFAKMRDEGRIIADDYPNDWKYYTLTYPVVRYKNLTWREAVHEMNEVNRHFYTLPKIARRVAQALWLTRRPLSVLAGAMTNLSYRYNRHKENQVSAELDLSREKPPVPSELHEQPAQQVV